MRKLLVVFVFVLVRLSSYSQSICGGSSATLSAPNPSNLANPNYTLNPGNFPPVNGNQFVVSPGTTATYTMVTGGLNASNVFTTTSAVTTVTVFAQPNMTPSFTQASCANSSNTVNLGLTFTGGAPSPAYTVSWTPLPGSVLSQQQTTATALTPGPYTITVTGPGGCAQTIYFTMNAQPAPASFSVLPFGGNYSITCLQTSIDLSTTNANLTYTWSGGSFPPVVSPSLTVNSGSLGIIGVTGQNPLSGCVKTYTFNIGINQAVPTASLSNTLLNVNCTQTSVPTISMTATPSVNITHYIYSGSSGTFVATSHTAIFTGPPKVYTYVLVNNANGCSVTKQFTITSSDEYPTFNVTSAVHNFTLGCNARATASITIENGASTIPPFGGAVTYTIIGPSTAQTPVSGSLSPLTTYTINVPGTWTVIVHDNTNGCRSAFPLSIVQNTYGPSIGAYVPLQTLSCANPTTSLEGLTGAETNISYSWGFTGGNVASSTKSVGIDLAAPTKSLIDTYTLTITNNNSTCKSTTLVPMYQNTYPPKAIISTPIGSLTCTTPTIILNHLSTTGVPPGSLFPPGFAIAALWEGPSPQVPLQVSTTYTAGVIGIYTLTARDQGNGCTAKGTYTVGDARVYPILITPPPATVDCGSTSTAITPTITGSIANFTYSWTPSPGAPPTGTNNLLSYQVSGAGTYSLLVRDKNNGCETRISVKASTGALTAGFYASPDFGYAPLDVVFTNTSSSSKDANNINAMWSFGNAQTTGSVTNTGSFVVAPISSTISPLVRYTQPGTYTIAMFAVKGTCLDTAYRVINVEIPSSLEVPNVFTPNNDGTNDLFFLRAKNMVEINMVIFDRWGHIVYELTSTTGNIEWDGKNAQGKDAAEGTYFYRLKTTGNDGVARDQSGSISLYR